MENWSNFWSNAEMAESGCSKSGSHMIFILDVSWPDIHLFLDALATIGLGYESQSVIINFNTLVQIVKINPNLLNLRPRPY